jgi:DUF438 domain-containing protein
MSELINNSGRRKELLKHMILQLHAGEAPEEVRARLVSLLKQIPYGEVVEVEQELISNKSLSEEEVLKFCDLHSQALEGHIDRSGMKIVPPGHPVDTFKRENKELLKVVEKLENLYASVTDLVSAEEVPGYFIRLKSQFNQLMDVEKHYIRKENLLFPFLEKHGITGPPKVMWGKHDEIRELLRGALDALTVSENVSPEESETLVKFLLKPASNGVADMVMKEEEILFPMTLDKLDDHEWYGIYQQTPEIGFCLYDPDVEWKPDNIEPAVDSEPSKENIRLSTGSFSMAELQAILNALPIDITFVDKNEKVKYFSQGKERIFPRNRAILNRDVKMCHPPSSVGKVIQILNDFRTGNEDSVPFWINLNGRFIHIEYLALKDENGDFLGTLEVSQDLTEKRALQGEQRILSYGEKQ